MERGPPNERRPEGERPRRWRDLPVLHFTEDAAPIHEDKQRPDVAYGVKSPAHLGQEWLNRKARITLAPKRPSKPDIPLIAALAGTAFVVLLIVYAYFAMVP